MQQKILYSLIVVLLGVLAWQQVYRSSDSESVNSEPVASTDDAITTFTTTNDLNESETASSTKPIPEVDIVTVTGVYVGLRDEVGGDFSDTSMYLLLDDGTEIISIDLRPLIGTQKTGIESELSISRGDRLELTGVTEEGAFVVGSVAVVEE